MTFDRISAAIIGLASAAILAYGLTLATSAIDYAILGASGAAALLVLGLLAHPDNR
jgi:hypothetical protein